MTHQQVVYIAGSSKAQLYAGYIGSLLRSLGVATLHTWTVWDKGTLPSPEKIWETCIDEIENATHLLVVVANEGTLRGAIFEAGYAVGTGIPVAVFDPLALFEGDWNKSPGVTYCSSLQEVYAWLRSTGVASGSNS